MRTFTCSCPTRPQLFFESTSCETCGRLVGFSHTENAVLAFEPCPDSNLFRPVDAPKNHYRQCQNYALYKACNGMIAINSKEPDSGQSELCEYCRFNHTIPDLSVEPHLPLWRKLEVAKRRTLFTLTQLKLPLLDRRQDPTHGLSFYFMADKTASDHFQSPLPNQEPVLTGHDEGNITVNLAEADEVARANAKVSMGERYRTLLGHFRHEIGHYFWDVLIATDSKRLNEYRELFGNEEQDYQEALDKHYRNGPPPQWEESFISAYATMHPWEDWAETWAHYLHVVDTLETAQNFGVKIQASRKPADTLELADIALPQQVSYYDQRNSIDDILSAWMNFSVVLNSLNRSMGLPDAYPFVLYPKILDKLKFIHTVVHEADEH